MNNIINSPFIFPGNVYSDVSDISSVSQDSQQSVQSLPLSAALHQQLAPFSSSFRVAHINAQSLTSHHAYLLATFGNRNFHAILVSETWLKSSLPDVLVSIPGYNFVRNDRSYSGGGGVGIYLRDGIDFSVLQCSDGNAARKIEYLLVEVRYCYKKLLLGVVYRAPGIVYSEDLESLLSTFLPHFDDVILMGDFNAHLELNNLSSTRFKDLFKSFNMSILPSRSTYHLDNVDTLLDVTIVKSPSKVQYYEQAPAPGFSHHDLLFMAYQFGIVKYSIRKIRFRDFRNMNIDNLIGEAEETSWNLVNELSDPSAKVELFTNMVTGLLNKHAPLKNAKVKYPPTPWLTPEVLKLMRRRDRAYNKYRKTKLERHFEKFKLLRNRCNRSVRDSKEVYISQGIASCKDEKSRWQFLRSLGINCEDSSKRFDTRFNLDDLNKHFVTPPVTLDPTHKLNFINNILAQPDPIHPEFSFQEISSEDVRRVFSTIRSNACGNDDLSIRFLKPIFNSIVDPLTDIINSSLSSGVFPQQWKIGRVVPLPKISKPKGLNDFRAISLLPVFSKVLEKIVHHQILSFCNSHSLFNPYQSGFRPGHSTTTALVKVADDIRRGMERTQVTILLLSDFSKAFDSVDFDILTIKLFKYFKFSPSVIRWFNSYLRNRQQFVFNGDNVSCPLFTSVGVPQGSILGPLLFSLFINDIGTSFQHCSFHLYADDLQLYIHTSVDNVNGAINMLNDDLNHLHQWTVLQGILPNPNKFQSIIIGSTPLLHRVSSITVHPIIFNSAIIPLSPTVKNLGLIFDSTLSWNAQVINVGKKVFRKFHSLNRLKRFLPLKTKKLLCTSLIFPTIEYGGIVLSNMSCMLLKKLQSFQNACIRYIFGLRKHDHVSELRSSVMWLPVGRRLEH
ncbi:hypothetical protein WDU94_010887 [Cyamophila willieti]